MSYFNELAKRFDVVAFMEDNGYSVKFCSSGRTKYLTTCPWCGKENHFGFDPGLGVYGCFKCKVGGTIFKLIKKVYGKSFYETLELLKDNVSTKHLGLYGIESLMEEIKPYKQIEDKIHRPIQMPDSYVQLRNNRIPYLDVGRKFPIPQDQVQYYRMGCCSYGMYKDRLIVCDINDQNQPYYWVARDITGRQYPKILNPIGTEIGSGDCLFNFFLAKNYSCGIICEGVFDALYVGNNAMATYSVGLKGEQLYWLTAADFESIIILYDADVEDEVLSKTASKIATLIPTYICKLPDGDPDEYPKDQLMSMLKQAKLYTGNSTQLRFPEGICPSPQIPKNWLS